MAPPNLIPEGVPLERVAGLSVPQIRALHDCWISTAQELAGVGAAGERATAALARALRVNRSRLDALIQAAHKVLPTERTPSSMALAQAAARAKYGRGAVPPPASRELASSPQLAYRGAAGLSSLPASCDLLVQLPAPRDQGERSTCVAFAVCAMREQLEVRAGSELSIDLSEQYVYWWCKRNDGLLRQVHGTFLSAGVRCLEKTGAPLETTWPYQPDQEEVESQGPPPEAAASGDSAFRTIHTVRFSRSDITGIKIRLVEGFVVAFTIPIFDSWYASPATARWGKITLPLPGEGIDGGHALAIVGYQDDPAAPGGGYFIVRNSWPAWSYEGVWQPGYGYLPYAYLTRFAWEVLSAERMEAADLVVHDSPQDTGIRPLRAVAYNSPDVWVRSRPDGHLDAKAAAPGESKDVYARVTNRGPAYVYGAQVAILAAPLAAQVQPDAWQPIARVDGACLPPGETILGPFGCLLPAGQWQEGDPFAEWSLRIEVGGAVDPAGQQMDARTNNNVAERHVCRLELAPGEATEVSFEVARYPLSAEVPHFALNREDLPEEIEIGPIELDPFPMPGTSERLRAHFLVRLPPSAEPGGEYACGINQLAGLATVGRITVQLAVR